MAPHHDDRERHGSHPLVDYREPEARSHSEEMMERLEMESAPIARSRWSFDWSLNIGHVLAIVTVVLGCFSTYYGIKGEIQDSRRDNKELAARVLVIEQGRSINLPRFEEVIRSNGLQDQRIQNLTEALASLRLTVVDLARAVTEQSSKIADAHEQTAILSERIGRGVPHDR